MKASVNWLCELVPSLPRNPLMIAEVLTKLGLEVEGIHSFGAASSACVVAKVVWKKAHPQRENLTLVGVMDGSEHTVEIVCGASNVPEPGGLVVLAKVGTHLPAVSMTIEKRKVYGVESSGMLCSESELGLSDDASGLLVLPSELPIQPGTPLAQALPSSSDTIFEIGLTPNRPDCLGHRGLARELALGFQVPNLSEQLEEERTIEPKSGHHSVEICIDDAERAPRYAALKISGFEIKPSPSWIRYRLFSLGIRPISNVVDATNWVMMEYGHPMHAFDWERISGKKIVVRMANEGELLKTLDGLSRTLSKDDLVIADAEKPLALAGIMGGEESSITEKTTEILFESAYFEPRGIRRSARRHGIHTESSHRFERGISSEDTLLAMKRATSLLFPTEQTLPPIHDTIAKKWVPLRVSFRLARAAALLGIPLDEKTTIAILNGLGLKTVSSNDQEMVFEIPSHRPDLTREIDLIEEVIRVHGIDTIPAVLPAIRPSRSFQTREDKIAKARHVFVELGLSEALTYSFVSTAWLTSVFAPEPVVMLQNPLSELQNVLRTSLLPGLLDATLRAKRHGQHTLRLFTVGPIFLKSQSSDGLPEERLHLTAILTGDRPTHLSKPEPMDAWDGKGLALGALKRLTGYSVQVKECDEANRPKWLHPKAASELLLDTEKESISVGFFGILHPEVGAAFDMEHALPIVVSLDIEQASQYTKLPKFKPIPRFPSSSRDMAVVVRETIRAGDVLKVVSDVAGPLAENVEIFDKFQGGSLPLGHTSLGLRVVYRAEGRTLTDAEVDTQHARVVSEVGIRFGAVLRT